MSEKSDYERLKEFLGTLKHAEYSICLENNYIHSYSPYSLRDRPTTIKTGTTLRLNLEMDLYDA